MNRARRPRATQAGFTLVELMISLVMSSLLVAMIITVYTSMSQGYRVQQQVAEVQQVLGAAQDMISSDLRQVGLAMPGGLTTSTSVSVPRPALDIIDGVNGAPDELRIFYADPTAQARITTAPLTGSPVITVPVDSVDRFAQGDLVVMTFGDLPDGLQIYDSSTPPSAPEEPALGTVTRDERMPVFYACALQVESVSSAGGTITFRTGGDWGAANNIHCQWVTTKYNQSTSTTKQLMLYRLTAHAYRIDTTRPTLGVLQLSLSGGLLNDWQDLGIGFTDLQLASRWYEGTGADNTDVDTDPKRNWYSDAEQTSKAALSAKMTPDAPALATAALRVSVSLVARTTSDVIGAVVTDTTPNLTDAARPGTNEIGNHAAATAMASRVYRYTTFKVDVRNLGIGR